LEIQVRGLAPIGMVECWNNGIMGSGIMQYWVNGKIFVEDKIKNSKYPFKNQLSNFPIFHIQCKRSSLKKCLIF
jgi:hypothetical protein